MDYIDGDKFHSEIKKVYSEPLNWAVNKKNEYMAKVVYEAPHKNENYEGEKRGKGKDYVTWIFSEEADTAEKIFTSLDLILDAKFEAGTSIGLHKHENNKEIYYILDGSISMVTISEDGEKEHREILKTGDVHMCNKGQSHYGTAGENGVRFITVAVKD